MTEIIEVCNIFDTITNDKIYTAHVCEGPGGFIESVFNEAIRRKKTINTCYAMTLRSKQTNVPGWKRATNFLQKNKNIKILYGDDGTGDILKLENQLHFTEQTNHKCNIFTADGGFDFSNNYINQEKLIFPLLVSSSKIGIESLKKGGYFVLKIFDIYQKSTIDLIYILSCLFNEWTIYKPATSRPCNPEHYFIGKHYTSCNSNIIDLFTLWSSILQSNKLESLFSYKYPIEYTNIITDIQTSSFKMQIDYLEKVFSIIDNNNENIINNYLKINEKISYEWCKRFKVPIYLNRFPLIEE
jgi:hypothetical protein